MSNTVKRGTVMVVSKDLAFHLSAHGSVQLAKGTEVRVTRNLKDGHANVEGYVTKRYTGEVVNARFMINLSNATAK